MIKINPDAWKTMVDHAQSTFPDECCGVMVGKIEGETKLVTSALGLENAYKGGQEDRYEIRPADLGRRRQRARAQGLVLIGIFHSHPDCDAYFSKTDLENSCPWYSFVVLSVKGGKFDHANSFLPNADQTAAEKEDLIWPKS